MKRKYILDRFCIGGDNFIDLGKIVLIIEADVPVYNLKWFIDRKRKLNKCPKCKQPLTIVKRSVIINQKKLERPWVVYCCLKCNNKPKKIIKISFLKNNKLFDIFRAAEKFKKRREQHERKNFGRD